MKRSGFKSREAETSLPSASVELKPLLAVPSIAIDEGVTVICPSELTEKQVHRGILRLHNPKNFAEIQKTHGGFGKK